MSERIDYSSSDDFEGNHVSVVSTTQRHKAGVFVGGPVHAGRNRQIAVIKKDDAPAAALALLQASGWKVPDWADENPADSASIDYAPYALGYLVLAVRAKAREDAEAEILALAKVLIDKPTHYADWDDAPDIIKAATIKQARAAWEHMKGETND